jgi:hypothetical protein
MNYQIKNILFLYLTSVLFWISLVIYRERESKDINCLRKLFIPKCNGWCVLHFIHYTFLGFFAPKYWKHLIVIGILFEIAEIYLNNVSKYIDSKLLEDSITNSLGIIFGLVIYKKFPHNIDILKIIKRLF